MILAPVARKVNITIHQISPIQQIKLMQLSKKVYLLDRTYPVDSFYSPFVQPGPGHFDKLIAQFHQMINLFYHVNHTCPYLATDI